MKRLGIIPARYGSSRFPGKPLAHIGGLTMIERVYAQASKSELDQVVVATDHEDIAAEVRRFGGVVAMTDSALLSGTDRCRAALETLNLSPDFVVNIQGDEPFIDPTQINQVLRLLEKPECGIATLISPCTSDEEISNLNRVKAVVDKDGKALYFSRQAIPYLKGIDHGQWHLEHKYYVHLGIYGFRTPVLRALGDLEQSALEKAESLEQLRWLENGFPIYTATTALRADAVDTPEDLKAIEKKFFL
jgi:3-deoxy-manno-octulosonate cytidylyltransferase (CMP-KDO synthetase)